MQIRHKDIQINPDNPFENCKLGREKYADILTSIVSTYAEGFVMAINSEWGTGKTTFVRMWQQKLIKKEFKTLYFNAWENDFENSALVALIAELKTLIEKEDASGAEGLFKTIVEKGAILAKNIPAIFLKAAIAKYIDKETLEGEVLNALADGVNDIFQEQVSQYSQKKEGLVDFKESLATFVEGINGGKPIVFIIDELDRCRPDYAVEVLEKVKHFFSVPNIVFVLSIDKEQLGHAVRGVYGSENINSDEYLRRFIDIEYTIPAPDTETFCRYLYEYFEFGKFMQSEMRKFQIETNKDPSYFLQISSILFEKEKLSLRQQEKLFAHARIVLNQFQEYELLLPELFIFLIYIKNYHSNLFEKIKESRISIEQLQDHYARLVSNGLKKSEILAFTRVEALLVFLYNNLIDELQQKPLFRIDENRQRIVEISSSLESFDQEFKRLINYCHESTLRDMKISFLIERIDLTKSFK